MRLNLIIILSFVCSFAFSQDYTKKHLYYGNLAFNEGDYETALSHYKDAVSYSPNDFKANYNLANAKYRLNDFEGAIEQLEKIAQLGPTSLDKAKALHNLGNAQLLNQDLDGAIESYKSALRLNPSDEETRYNLAYALQKKKEQEQQEQNQDQNQNGGDGQQGDGQQSQNQNQNDNQNQNNDGQNNDENQGDQQNKQQNSSDQNNDNQQDGTNNQYMNKLSKEEIEKILSNYYKREKDLQKKLSENERVGYGMKSKKDW